MNTQVRKYLLKKEKRICADHGYKMTDKYLGGGATGRVFLAQPTERKTRSTEKLNLVKKEDEKLQVAIKIYYADVGSNSIGGFATYLPAEIGNCNKCFGVPNIVMLLDVFVSCKRIFLVFEHAAKGDLTKTLLDHISTKQLGEQYMEEDVARHYFREIAKGVQQLHRRNIAHRDLKPDNILVTGDGQIKLCDLGFSIAGCDKNKNSRSFVTSSPCGTPGFAAPEIFDSRKHPYDPLKADVWSMGVILFLLTNGRYPFKAKTSQDIQKEILITEGEPLPFREGLSSECKELISRMLTTPKKRPTVQTIVGDQWLVQYKKKESPPSTKHLRNIADNLVYRFQATYVRNYLYQRKRLLLERRKFLLKNGCKAEDLRNAGIMFSLPRKDTGGVTVNEVWRFERNESPETDTLPVERNKTAKLKALKDPWAWCPDVEEPTLGIGLVERVVKDLPMLSRWAAILDNEFLAKEGFERSLKNYNTVDVEGYRNIFFRHPHDKEMELASCRQNILGFYPKSYKKESKKQNSKEEDKVSEKGTKSGLIKRKKRKKMTKDKKSKEELKLDTDENYPPTAKKHISPKTENPAVHSYYNRHGYNRPLPKVPGESYELLTDKLQLEHCRPYGLRPARINATTPIIPTEKSTKIQNNLKKIKDGQENLMKKLSSRDKQKFKSLQEKSKPSRENGAHVIKHQPRLTECKEQLSRSANKIKPCVTESTVPQQAQPPLKRAEVNQVQERILKASDINPLVVIKKRLAPKCLKNIQVSPEKVKERSTIPNVKPLSSKDTASKKANNAALKPQTVDQLVKLNSKPCQTQTPHKIKTCLSKDNTLFSYKRPTATLKTSNQSCVAKKFKRIQSARRQTTICGPMMAPVPPSHEGNLSAARKRRILKRQSELNLCKKQEITEVNPAKVQSEKYSAASVVKQYKEPRPPTQDREMSAARKRRILKRQSLLKENTNGTTQNKYATSPSANVLNHQESASISQSKLGFAQHKTRTTNRGQICKETVKSTKHTSRSPLQTEQISSSTKYIVAPTPPKQGNKFSAARMRRIANRQSAQILCGTTKKSREANLNVLSPIQQCKVTVEIIQKEPVPPKQIGNISAAQKMQSSNRGSSQRPNNQEDEYAFQNGTLTRTGQRSKNDHYRDPGDKQQHFKSERTSQHAPVFSMHQNPLKQSALR